MPQSARDPYLVLGVAATASGAEIKAAYRALVKQHHPDAGGDEEAILAINAAWEVLRDRERRAEHDRHRVVSSHESTVRSAAAGRAARKATAESARGDEALLLWLQTVYGPIDRLLGQVINPFPAEFKALSADPYDDQLMEAFCSYLEQSQAKLEKVETLYRSMAAPASAQGFSLSVYHCLSQVKDAVVELERYTMGYVDNYLHDGREMLREAKQRRTRLQAERRRLDL
ncbi:MAG: J domain-containing protein [Vulcanococcus sp.]